MFSYMFYICTSADPSDRLIHFNSYRFTLSVIITFFFIKTTNTVGENRASAPLESDCLSQDLTVLGQFRKKHSLGIFFSLKTLKIR